MQIGELFIKLGFHADTFTLKDFSKTMGELPMKAITAAAGIAGVSLEIGSLVKSAMEAAGGFALFTAETGLSSNEMQRWALVAEQMSMKAGTAESSFLGLYHALKAAEVGIGTGATYQALKWLHVDPKGPDGKPKDANVVMEEIRGNISKLTPDEMSRSQSGGFRSLGIDQAMIMAFGKLTARDFESRKGKVPIMDQEQIKAIAAFNSALAVMAENIRHLVVGPLKDLTIVIQDLVPVLKKLLPPTYNFLKQVVLHTPIPYLGGLFIDKDKQHAMMKTPLYHFVDAASKQITDLGTSVKHEMLPTLATFGKETMGAIHNATTGMLEMAKNIVSAPTYARALTDTTPVSNYANDLNLTQHNYFSGDPREAYESIMRGREMVYATKFFGGAGT